MVLQPTRRRFTVGEYHRMVQAGILGEDDRVELIEGELLEMTPIGDRHARCVRRLTHVFADQLRGLAIVSVQNPVALEEHSEPQPDIALLRPRADFYPLHPTAADILLLVEVADTSADIDRRVKVPLYARSGVPETWLLDLEQETVTAYRDPAADGYRAVQVLRRGEQLAPAACPERAVAVDDLLG